MDDGGRRWYGQVDRTHPHLREHVLEEIRARGPLGSRHFDGAARQGEMWGWKPAKQMLELLWNHGDLVVAGRQGFQRLYDVPERVLPAAVLDAPTPAEPERLRVLALRAVHARGALTERGVVEHWRLKGGTARLRATVASLVADGELERLARRGRRAPTSSSRPGRSSTGRGRRSRSSSRRSRTSSGTGRSHAASSASTT